MKIKTDKLLSIVIPAYNVEKYIERCLISLTKDEEVLKKVELIVVNDGGVDKTLEIAKRYENKFQTSIIVIDKENGGHGSTINAGLKVATGKYFRVIDSDDWVNVDDFPKFVKELKSIDADVVLTNYSKEFVYNGTSEFFSYNPEIEYNKVYNFDDFNISLLKDDYFFMATTTFKTEVLRKANFNLDEKTFYVDTEFVIFPIPFVNTFIYLNYDIYRYFIGRKDQSVNISSFVKNRSHHEKVLKRVIKFYNNTELSENKKKYISKIIIQLINTHYVIYCKSKLNKKEHLKEIKNLDRYLRDNAFELYDISGRIYGYIRWNRRTKFIFAQAKKSWFSRLIDFYERRNSIKGGELN